MKQRHSNNYICTEIPGSKDFLLNNQCKSAEPTHLASFVSLASKSLAVQGPIFHSTSQILPFTSATILKPRGVSQGQSRAPRIAMGIQWSVPR